MNFIVSRISPNHLWLPSLLSGLLSIITFNVQASNLVQGEIYFDEQDRSSAEVTGLTGNRAWVLYEQTVSTDSFSTGNHTVNLVVLDDEDSSSIIYKMPLYISEQANYDLAGQSNVIVTSTLERSNRNVSTPLATVKSAGKSADGAVWARLSAQTYFEPVDIGQRTLLLSSTDAYSATNSDVIQHLNVDAELISGLAEIKSTNISINGLSLAIESEMSVGSYSITYFDSPSSFDSVNNLQFDTVDWQDNSTQLGDAYFAFYDNDTDFIDDRFDPDLDNDGLTNEEEIALGTDPTDSDSDGDGVSDFIEVANEMDPLDDQDIYLDADNDGLTNEEELAQGTGVNNSDSDDDGINDGLEVLYGLNPTNGADAALDKDGDGISNLEEVLAGLLPNDPDSDGDGIDDGVELALGLDPLDALDALADADGDGISNIDEIALGTDINNADSDGDGISDGVEIANGSDPLDENSFVGKAETLIAFDDLDNDGVNDWLVIYEVNSSEQSINIISGANFASLVSYSIQHLVDNAEVFILNDRNADDVSEIGVFGFDSAANRYQLVVHNSVTGNKFGAWNWPATLGEVKFEALTDLTQDGIQEYAISGVHLVNGTRQLVVKDGSTKASYQTFKWPNLWDNSRFVTMTDVTFDSVPEVALYGRHTRLDKGQLFIYDGANASSKVDVYNWNKLWSNIELVEMDDLDGDGTGDWGQFGQRKDDGRYQWLVKKGHDKRGVIRTFSWPNDLVDVKPLLVGDRTGDDIREVALFGTNPNTGKVFLRINDGRLPNTRIANISWPANWEDVQVKELGDLNNDGFNEFGLLGFTKSNRTAQLIIKDGNSLAEYGRYTIGIEWEGLSFESQDVNEDGYDDVIVIGVNQSTYQQIVMVLDGSDLTYIDGTVME
ncbi:hypothetical protein [Shewanella sp. 6_MG-2023]|uniref:hypothetical protein n=1 Tax=Shewanella sp. 6_MG-2023 TaxID=3062660 RepID=UPI0026E2D7A9|nr:hypothetical protein [Shewanella sp. 6_MG-2023]MDO6617636.1 hypothetical protein [Shewanella sp. 6_MG-2023]